MDLIELHILQSFPVTCLNRDDLGAPKSALFGGQQRARVSSQSWKRAIRMLANEHRPELFSGTRTRFVVRELKRLYAERGQGEVEALELAESTADAVGKLDDPVKGNVKTLLYFSPMEMASVVEAALEEEGAGEAVEAAATDRRALAAATDAEDKKAITAAEEAHKKSREALDKITKKASKQLKKVVKDAADIAIFGRMVADDHSLMVEGAGLFSHALSTHRATNEVEFFSAVDDTSGPGDEGAGHIGTLEYNSACYYRYAGLNLDLLRDVDHLGHFSDDELSEVVRAFLRATILAVPAARKNSMFGFNPPVYVLGLRRRGQPLSLVNAFERTVEPSSSGYIEPSIERLKRHRVALGATYGLEATVEAELPAVPLDELVETLSDGITPEAG